jgi:AcrR family transcriptional regulator
MSNGSGNETRRAEIRAAAARLLLERGYGATSMLQIAKAASASNETLYRWYGNKQQLFAEMVDENARAVSDELEADDMAADPLATLQRIGPKLLMMVTGDLAIALNRAAVTDVHETGQLGAVVAERGRGVVVPLLVRLIEKAASEGLLGGGDAETMADVYVRLLIGDLQIRRAIGAIDHVSMDQAIARAEQALALFLSIYRPASGERPTKSPAPRGRA